MFCFKCGSQQADDARFCGVCGTGLAGVVAPQSGPPVAVVPSVGPPPADSSPAREMRAAAAWLTVDEWAVTCTPPDGDGDVRFEAKVRGEFHGATAAHVARLSSIAFDSTGTIPLLQGDNTLNQDLDDEDSVEIEASGYRKLGEGVEPGACQISGQVVLYPGERQAPWTIPLPEAGQVGGEGPAWPDMGAEIAGWRLTCSDSSDESASYTLCIVPRNFGTQALAAVTFRVRVKNRKGDVWSTEHLVVERLAPGEMRSVETNLYVSERAKTRKGAMLELVGVVCEEARVLDLPSVNPSLTASETSDDEATLEEQDSTDARLNGKSSDGATQLFYAKMEGFDAEGRDASLENLPPEFAEAKRLWREDKEVNHDRIIETLSKCLGAIFIPHAINGYRDLFATDDSGEFGAKSVRLVDVDFGRWNIPVAWAEAVFEVPVTGRFKRVDLQEWQENNDQLWPAVSFGLRMTVSGATEDAGDGERNIWHPWENNAGCECLPVDVDPIAEDSKHSDQHEDQAPSDEDEPEIPVSDVAPPFISYQVNDETVLEASDDFESTATDFESEVLGRINSSGEVAQFRKHMESLAKMVVKGSYRANWVTCESEDSRIDLTFTPGNVTCIVHKYVVESE